MCYSEDMQTTTSPSEIAALFYSIKQEGQAARVAHAGKFFETFDWAEQLALVGWYGSAEEAVEAMAGSIEQVKEEEMPLPSYTIIHKEADLTPEERATLTQWCQSIMDTLKANYPADSLKLNRASTPEKAK